MSFNGSGVYSPPAASFPAVANTLIESAKFNAVINDIATALSTCVTKDGQTVITANLPMSGFRHTGVGNATARDNYAATGQVQDGTLNWVVAGGTADALTATYAPALTTLVDGQLCHVRAASANATTTPTFSPNSLTARTITKLGGSAVVASEWTTDQELILRYKLASTRWELLNTRKIANTEVSGLGTMSTQAASAVAITGGSVTGITDLTVADGGTGASTFTDGGVLIGNGTSAIQVTTAGTSGHVLTSNGAGVDPTFQALPTTTTTLATPQASTSGTSIDFTSIPAGTKKITVMFDGVSTNGTSVVIVQIGDSGGVEATGYTARAALDNTSQASYTTGFGLDTSRAAGTVSSGSLTLTLMNSSTNTWVADGTILNAAPNMANVSGIKALSAELDRVRITTVNGTDAFDAGSINISYGS